MIDKTEIPYLMALTHDSKLPKEMINSLLVKVIHERKSSLESFFLMNTESWKTEYLCDEKMIAGILLAKNEVPNNAFIAESLFSQGYEVLPIYSPEYSRTLKENLKVKLSPPILYVKGNTKILQEPSVAIVGSRDASPVSLEFTDNIAKMASKEYKVVVSGFAKGVDKQALDSAIKYKGQSIIVLPQGIMTFDSGIKKYYSQIVNGDVLVLSTFFPKAPWSVPLAMGRNPYIYGLAKDIYVAESGASGGTWSGAMDGLKKGRRIFVRYPDGAENNANVTLIEQGGTPVDHLGVTMENVPVAVHDRTVEYRSSTSGTTISKNNVKQNKKRGKKINPEEEVNPDQLSLL